MKPYLPYCMIGITAAALGTSIATSQSGPVTATCAFAFALWVLNAWLDYDTRRMEKLIREMDDDSTPQ